MLSAEVPTFLSPFRKNLKKNDYFFSRKNLFKNKLISIIIMIIPLKELEGFPYTEHINLKNGLNIIPVSYTHLTLPTNREV